MRKSRLRLIVAGLIVVGLCGVCLDALIFAPIRAHQWVNTGFWNARVCALMLTVAKNTYEQLGIEVDSWKALERSPFFPVDVVDSADELLKPCEGGEFFFSFERSGQEVCWKVAWKGSRFLMGEDFQEYRLVLPQRSEEERTRVFLAALVRPPEEWHKQLEAFYEGLRRHRQVLGRHLPSPEGLVRYWVRYCGQSLRVKDLSAVRARAVALGRLRGERYVSEYVRFLREVLGLELVDGWGRAVRLEWRGGELVASSAGADGRWGSGDEVVVRGRVVGGGRE